MSAARGRRSYRKPVTLKARHTCHACHAGFHSTHPHPHTQIFHSPSLSAKGNQANVDHTRGDVCVRHGEWVGGWVGGWVGETIVYYIYNHSLLASIWWEGAEGVGGWMWVWVTLVRGRWELIPPTKTAPVGLVWSTGLFVRLWRAVRPCMTSSSLHVLLDEFVVLQTGIPWTSTLRTETRCPWKRWLHETSPERVEERQERSGEGGEGVERDREDDGGGGKM